MKLFKTVDDKFRDIGFVKQWDNDLSVTYTRIDKESGCVHCIGIARHINNDPRRKPSVVSYMAILIGDTYHGERCVELTYYEMQLVLKKMRQKRWTSK